MARRGSTSVVAMTLGLGLALGLGCASEGSPSPAADASASETQVTPGRLGEPCRSGAECLSGLCLRSEYGPPFCTRACQDDGVPCADGVDATEGETLCVSYAEPPFPDTPPFKGDLQTFCAPRCADMDTCEALNASWESCETPRWLGDPLYPEIGQIKVCLAPSYHGKDPVDPSICDWDKTVTPKFASDANLCRTYCGYLQTCQRIPADAEMACCEWGCFNRMVIDGERDDAWYDAVKCYVDNHGAFPPVGTQNFCSEPEVNCGGVPRDPTPPAALDP